MAYFKDAPVYESNEGFGMKGWFRSIKDWITSREQITSKTSAYTVEENIYHVRVDTTGGAVTITLPPALARDGRQILITRTSAGANAVTVACSGSDTIQGSASVSLASQWAKALVISNGNNGWERIV